MEHFPDYTKVTYFGDWEIIRCLAGNIYSLAPDYQPRNLQTIVDSFFEKFKNRAEVLHVPGVWLIHCNCEEFSQILHEILFSIPEFMQLNLTNTEYEAGLRDVEDPRRAEFGIDPNFIDLDACIQNTVNNLYWIKEGKREVLN